TPLPNAPPRAKFHFFLLFRIEVDRQVVLVSTRSVPWLIRGASAGRLADEDVGLLGADARSLQQVDRGRPDLGDDDASGEPDPRRVRLARVARRVEQTVAGPQGRRPVRQLPLQHPDRVAECGDGRGELLRYGLLAVERGHASSG